MNPAVAFMGDPTRSAKCWLNRPKFSPVEGYLLSSHLKAAFKAWILKLLSVRIEIGLNND